MLGFSDFMEGKSNYSFIFDVIKRGGPGYNLQPQFDVYVGTFTDFDTFSLKDIPDSNAF